jgi:hypothetical protein
MIPKIVPTGRRATAGRVARRVFLERSWLSDIGVGVWVHTGALFTFLSSLSHSLPHFFLLLELVPLF